MHLLHRNGALSYAAAQNGTVQVAVAGTNPHWHLLMSARGNDGRGREQWFRRYNAPTQGGARKSETLKLRAWFDGTREAWAAQTNQALERLPEVHLGPTVQAMEARGFLTGATSGPSTSFA